MSARRYERDLFRGISSAIEEQTAKAILQDNSPKLREARDKFLRIIFVERHSAGSWRHGPR